MNRLVLALLILCAGGTPLRADVRTDADFVARLIGAQLATISLTGTTSDTGYTVSGELTTRGAASLVRKVTYVATSKGRRSGNDFRPDRYSETVIEPDRRKEGALDYQGGIPRAEGDKIRSRERLDAPLPLADQGDTVDPLTAIFMVLRDQPAAEVCPPLRQFSFDGERRSVVELTRVSESAEQITCSGQFRRVGGYTGEDDKRPKVLRMEVTYQRNGDVMQAQQMRLQTDFGPATLTRR